MTKDQEEEYQSVLEEQPEIVAENLKTRLNIDISPEAVGQIGLFFLKGTNLYNHVKCIFAGAKNIDIWLLYKRNLTPTLLILHNFP